MDRTGGIQTVFTCLITLQFIVIVSHDLVDIPGWTHGSQVRSTIGRRKLWFATLANSMFPGLAVAFAAYFWNNPTPLSVLCSGGFVIHADFGNMGRLLAGLQQ